MSAKVTELFSFANEFTSIRLSTVHGAAGIRVRVRSDRTGDSIDLDAVELEALTTMDHRGLRKLVRAATEQDSGNLAVGVPPPQR